MAKISLTTMTKHAELQQLPCSAGEIVNWDNPFGTRWNQLLKPNVCTHYNMNFTVRYMSEKNVCTCAAKDIYIYTYYL